MGSMSSHADEAVQGFQDKQNLLMLLKHRNLDFEIELGDYILFQNRESKLGKSAPQRSKECVDRYNKNKKAKCGQDIECASCGQVFKKKQYSQAFCTVKTKGYSSCKDFYHNFTSELRLQNTMNYL